MLGMKPVNANEFKFSCSHCDQPLKCDPAVKGSVPAIVEYCLDAQAPAESLGGMAR
jgi:hypothetical protein